MIASSKPLHQTPSWALVVMLLCAVGLLPLGVASAQDYDAVGKRLRAAVAAGELTQEQAKAMMVALKKRAGGNLRAVGMRLEQAVAAGELSADQARAMMGVLQEANRAQEDLEKELVAAHVRDYLAKLRSELGIAVRAGKMSREDAEKKYHAAETTIKQKLAARHHHDRKAASKKDPDLDRAKAYLMEVKKKLGAAIKEGKITEEEAEKKYHAVEMSVKARMAAGQRQPEGVARAEHGTDEHHAKAREYLMKVRRELGAAVRAGKISEKDAAKRFRAAEKAAARAILGAARREHEGGDKRRGL